MNKEEMIKELKELYHNGLPIGDGWNAENYYLKDQHLGQLSDFILSKLQAQKQETINTLEGIKAMDRKMLSIDEIINIINQ